MTEPEIKGNAVKHPADFIVGDGDIARRMREHDWENTPLGPPRHWPQSLKTVIRIMLTSRYAMWMGWGPELTFFCNDAYAPTLGVKVDRAIGRPASEVWAEIWPAVGPLIRDVMQTGEASWHEDLLLFLERSGAPEETYHTFSYSPLADDEGRTVGMFCAVAETTLKVVAERRMAALRDLGAAVNPADTEPALLQAVCNQLARNQKDLPFTLLYLFDQAGNAHLVGSTVIERGNRAAPDLIPAGSAAGWPVGEVLESAATLTLELLAERFGALPGGAWDIPPRNAMLVPIHAQAQQRPAGVFIAGLNPFRPLDADYVSFLELTAGQIASALANARSIEQARLRAEELDRIDRAKTAFFSNVSHEFRTPLTLMLGPLEEALASRHVPPGEKDQLRLAHRNGVRLMKLVNSLLNFSRIEAGRLQASYLPTALHTYTADLASNFRSAIEKAGLKFTVDCNPIEQPVYVDREMWEKIVLNLLSNAFKFTFVGEIRISLAGHGDRVALTVSDTGTGIPAAELPRMFERFHRIEGAKGRTFEGSGIGLALVKELVSLHGGTITVSSEEGRGTAFVVSIPLGSTHLPQEHVRQDSGPSVARGVDEHVNELLGWLPDPDIETAALPVKNDATPFGADAARPCILLADDNADMRAYVQRLLSARYDLECVPDGLQALQAARRRKPDLVLTDVMMPHLDGFGLIRALREDDMLKDLPVVVLSARAGEEARIDGLSRGADDYLVKPFSARELLARIDSVLTVARIRAQVNEALRESEVRFRTMADNSPVMIWTTDSSGSCTYLNRTWYQLTGQTPETGLGLGWVGAIHPDDREHAAQTFLAANASREAFALEYRLRRRDGVYRWAIDAAAPWLGSDGEFYGYIGSVIDITERKQAEQTQQEINRVLEERIAEAISERERVEAQLRHAQKLEAIGKLTGGIAHDFNNLLQIIAGNLELLSLEIGGNERAEKRVRNAIAGVSRGSKLSSQLLAFGRRQPLAPKVINLGRMIRNMDEMLRRALGDGVEVETVIAGGLWNTFVDSGQVENALLNLAINSRDAMRGHGRLTVEVGNASLDDDYARQHPYVRPGQYVMLAVTDTGSGIPEELLDRVFEPFFTTKPEGEGTGLGLSMVYGFVKQSGGHVKLYSEKGHGTTVRLYLPRSREAEDSPVVVDAGPVEGGTETILVVEDDEDVRTTVVEMLTDLDYHVLKAKDADSALVIIESGLHIDVLFTDVVMPGKLRSPDLARKAREKFPDIAVLFTSGYTQNAIVHGGKLDDGVELLSKPYTRDALARKLRQVLQKRA